MSLRDAKDNLVERLAEQQKKGGIKGLKKEDDHAAFAANAVPDVRSIEDYINPILNKIDRKPGKPKPKPKEGDGLKYTDESQSRHLGTYDWNLKTDQVTAHPGSYRPTATDVVRSLVGRMMKVPEYKLLLEQAKALCGHHAVSAVVGCANCERRERRYQELISKLVKRKKAPKLYSR